MRKRSVMWKCKSRKTSKSPVRDALEAGGVSDLRQPPGGRMLMIFAAVHESAIGRFLSIRDVCLRTAIEGRADYIYST
jgi:hypothetical protein